MEEQTDNTEANNEIYDDQEEEEEKGKGSIFLSNIYLQILT
jgi:hypothetical protein